MMETQMKQQKNPAKQTFWAEKCTTVCGIVKIVKCVRRK